jgi:hypothetical protein
MPMTEEDILRSEFRWAAVAVGAVSVIMLAPIYAGLCLEHHINPQSNLGTVDPNALHLTGEYTESKLRKRLCRRGVTVNVFQPRPTDTDMVAYAGWAR